MVYHIDWWVQFLTLSTTKQLELLPAANILNPRTSLDSPVSVNSALTKIMFIFPWFIHTLTLSAERDPNTTYYGLSSTLVGFLGGASGNEPTRQYMRHKRCGFTPWVGKIPRRSEWQPTPVFLPGKFHGQRSLVGYSPGGCKESDMTEVT